MMKAGVKMVVRRVSRYSIFLVHSSELIVLGADLIQHRLHYYKQHQHAGWGSKINYNI